MTEEEIKVSIYVNCVDIAHKLNQTVGEKNDYYITLEQLEGFLMNADLSTSKEKGQDE